MTTTFSFRFYKNLLLLALGSITIPAFSQTSWSLVYTPQEPTEHFNGIYAVNKDRVILSSEWGRVYRSTNACQSVELYQVQGNFSIFGDIGFTSPQNGFIGGGCWFPTGECTTSTMLRTTDGGDTWTAQQINNNLGVLMSVNTFPNGEVFVVGDYSGVYHFDPQTNTWDSLGSPAGISGFYTGLEFPDPQNGFLLHHSLNGDTLYRTQNGGVSWSVVQGNIPFFSNFSPFSMHFFDAQHGIIAGFQGTLFQTTDGGNNWTDLKEFGPSTQIYDMQFLDEQTGYISLFDNQTQKGLIYRTDDGGANWTPEFEVSDDIFHYFHFFDKNNGYALDGASNIYRRAGTSGTKGIKAENPLKISPNPVSNIFTVSVMPAITSIDGGSMFSLFDITGRKVLEQNLTSETTTVSCAALANGMYWYVCGGFTGKVVVQR